MEPRAWLQAGKSQEVKTAASYRFRFLLVGIF